MAYFLRQEKKKDRIYLQMYESYWDKAKKQPRSRSIEAFGYVDELISDEIPDPVAYYKTYVKKKDDERIASLKESTRPRAFSSPCELHVGHFLIHSLLEELEVKDTICPCSKSKTASSVFPHLYNSTPISEDQIYDGCAFIGESYKKYIEFFNHCYEQHYKRDFSKDISLSHLTIFLR